MENIVCDKTMKARHANTPKRMDKLIEFKSFFYIRWYSHT